VAISRARGRCGIGFFTTLFGATLALLLVQSFARAQIAAPAAGLAEGERLYQTRCASCHGARGEGDRGSALTVPRLIRASTDADFLKVIAGGIPGTEMPRFAFAEDEAAKIVAWVRHLGRQPPEQVSGDPGRGEQLYATKGECAACHFLRGQGGALGPDLTEIGLRRGAAYLRTALLEPNTHVPKISGAYPFSSRLVENFLFVRMVTIGGETIAGVRLNEDTFSIQMRDLSGRFHSFYKSELTELHKNWGRSPMPAYGTALSADELDDVVAYLVSLKGEE
jgi:putative heme-binding domain-containing protein